jgi:hypothetical protein
LGVPLTPSSNDLPGFRLSVIAAADHVLECKIPEIENMIEDLDGHIQNEEARNELRESIEILKAISPSMREDNYQKQEDALIFRTLAIQIKDVFRSLLGSYMTEKGLNCGDKNSVDYLNRLFYEDIARRTGFRKENLPQCYPPFTMMSRFLRNSVEHTDIRDTPVDAVTSKKSFGNVYTLCSSYILTVYAYAEILEIWLKLELGTLHVVP